MATKTVKKTTERIVRNVIRGNVYTAVDQVYTIRENLRNHSYSQEELRKIAPIFWGYTDSEVKRILNATTKCLLEELYKEERNYEETMRIIEALHSLDAANKIKQANNKVKFCVKFYNIAVNSSDLKVYLNITKLLDRK